LGYPKLDSEKSKIYVCTETAYEKHLCGISSLNEIAVQPSQEMTKETYKVGKAVPHRVIAFSMNIVHSGYYCVVIGENTLSHQISIHFKHAKGEIPAYYYPLIQFHTWIGVIYIVMTMVFFMGLWRFRRDIFPIQVS
jgi:hypothetical protein